MRHLHWRPMLKGGGQGYPRALQAMADPAPERRSHGPTPPPGSEASLAELPRLLAALAVAPGDREAARALAGVLAEHEPPALLPPLLAALNELPAEGQALAVVAVASVAAASS